MKVEINIARIPVNIATSRSVNPNKNETNHKTSNPPKSTNSTEALQKKRALIEAVVLTQIAQSFFQKAILVSTRLKEIALQGITSGKMNSTEIASALSGIRSSLKDIMEGFESEVSLPVQDFIKIYQFTSVKTDIPEINKELNLLSSITGNLSNAVESSGLKRIDRINSSLINKESALIDSYKQLIDGNIESGRFESFTNADFPKLSANISDHIVKHPESSLGIQGNLNYKTAKRLF